MAKIPLFKCIEVETASLCNTKCKDCMRQNFPDKEAIKDWFSQNLLPITWIMKACYEAEKIGFRGQVCLSHHNEPLLDSRLFEIANLIRTSFSFDKVFCCTNYDYFTDDLITKLDNNFDYIVVAIYRKQAKQEEIKKELLSKFKKAQVLFTSGQHVITNYGPRITKDLLNQRRPLPCKALLHRFIINHRGDMMLCCADMIGQYNLGSIKENTVEELWFGKKHQQIYEQLSIPNGRRFHHNCWNCPR